MEALDKLSYNSQIRQLRILGESALTHYDIGGAHLALQTHRDNTIFRVTVSRRRNRREDDPLDRFDDKRFMLRVCGRAGRSTEMLQSEQLWLAALCRETDLGVPEPVPTRNGTFVVEVMVEDIPEVRRCVLFRWVEGRFVDNGLTPGLFERVGTFMARLHQHARHFVPPSGFVRPRWSPEWQLGPDTVLDPDFVSTHCEGRIGEQERQILTGASERIREALSAIPQDAEHYGLIHSDLNQTNFLFHKGEVRAIDFDDCCWGYYLFDMAITLSSVAGRPDEDTMYKAFFRGYERIRALPKGYEEDLKVFSALRLIRRLTHLFRSDNPQTRAYLPAWQHLAFLRLKQFAGERVGQ
jgi:Ser/Thr protein kinase RdoA (MazF antagonist)